MGWGNAEIEPSLARPCKVATPQKGSVRKVAATPEKTTTPIQSPEKKKSKSASDASVSVPSLSKALEAAVDPVPPKSCDGAPEATRLQI